MLHSSLEVVVVASNTYISMFMLISTLFLVLLLHYISMALICSGRCYHLWNIAPHIGPSDTLMKTFAFDDDDDDDDDYNYNVDQKREHISVHRNICFSCKYMSKNRFLDNIWTTKSRWTKLDGLN